MSLVAVHAEQHTGRCDRSGGERDDDDGEETAHGRAPLTAETVIRPYYRRVATVAERAYGGQTMFEPLRRVLVRRPPADTSGWRRFGWRAQPDPVALAGEHEAFCLLLEEAGADVVAAPATTLDAIYTYDPAIVGDRGVVLLRPGKPEREDEVEAMAVELEKAGVPIAARLEAPQLAEGGDTAWLDERTFLAGRGYRTNSDGIWTLERILGVDTLVFDLPHFHGSGACMHLLSLFSPLDRDLVVAYPRRCPSARPALRRARNRHRRGAGRGVRRRWAERARSRAQAGARPRAERRDPAPPGARRGRRRCLPRRGTVEGRRRPDLPHPFRSARAA